MLINYEHLLCRSGRHVWHDTMSRERCCNGYELRLQGGWTIANHDPEDRNRLSYDVIGELLTWMPVEQVDE